MLEREELEAFLAAAKHLNFARAARELKMNPSHFSKRITLLEKKAKKKLFSRTTRIVRLTDQGNELLPAARKAMESLQDAQDIFLSSRENSLIQGKIRITCPHTLALRKIIPLTADFHALHPNITIEFVLSDAYLDLIEENLDMGIRIMTLQPSSMIVRKLGENHLVFCASPEYLRTHPPLKTVEDLKNHEIMAIQPHFEMRFQNCGRRLADVCGNRWIECMNGDLLVGLAERGQGVLVRSLWGVERELKEGRLVKIDLGNEIDVKTAVFAVYPHNKFLLRRVRLWIDFLAKHYSSY